MPDSAAEPSVRFVVAGRVQGVGFRYRCQRQARDLDVRGWVQNREDGRVHGVVQGAEPALTAMLNWLRNGPPGARIDDMQSEAVEAERFDDFSIR